MLNPLPFSYRQYSGLRYHHFSPGLLQQLPKLYPCFHTYLSTYICIQKSIYIVPTAQLPHLSFKNVSQVMFFFFFCLKTSQWLSISIGIKSKNPPCNLALAYLISFMLHQSPWDPLCSSHTSLISNHQATSYHRAFAHEFLSAWTSQPPILPMPESFLYFGS